MSTEDNKAIVRRFFEEFYSKGNAAAADEILAPNHVNHLPGNPPDLPLGAEGYKQLILMYRSAFPNLRATLEEQIVEDDKVVTRTTTTGTNTASLFGMPPTNKSAVVTGIVIDRIENGKIVETWAEFDQLGMMQQLGVIPAPGQAS